MKNNKNMPNKNLLMIVCAIIFVGALVITAMRIAGVDLPTQKAKDDKNSKSKKTEQEADKKPSPNPNPQPNQTADAPQAGPRLSKIALTFDDGPGEGTERIINAIHAAGGKATLCVLGQNIWRNPAILKQAVDWGFDVVGHSWSHKDLTKLDDVTIEAEIKITYEEIQKVTGQSLPLYRPPYGAYDDRLVNISSNLGFSLLCWDVDTMDWKYKDPPNIINHILTNAKDGDIIILHDIYSTTADATDGLIPQLKERGFQLVSISELLTSKGQKIESGKIYLSRDKIW